MDAGLSRHSVIPEVTICFTTDIKRSKGDLLTKRQHSMHRCDFKSTSKSSHTSVFRSKILRSNDSRTHSNVVYDAIGLPVYGITIFLDFNYIFHTPSLTSQILHACSYISAIASRAFLAIDGRGFDLSNVEHWEDLVFNETALSIDALMICRERFEELSIPFDTINLEPYELSKTRFLGDVKNVLIAHRQYGLECSSFPSAIRESFYSSLYITFAEF